MDEEKEKKNTFSNENYSGEVEKPFVPLYIKYMDSLRHLVPLTSKKELHDVSPLELVATHV